MICTSYLTLCTDMNVLQSHIAIAVFHLSRLACAVVFMDAEIYCVRGY